MSVLMNTRRIRWETWALSEEADRRFRKILLYVAIPALILAILITIFQFAEKKTEEVSYNGGQYVQLVASQKAPEVGPPEAPKPAAHDNDKPVQQSPKPAVKPQPKPVVPQETAREAAQKTKEMQAIQDSLSDLRDQNLNTITSQTPLTTGVISSKGGGAAASGTAIGESAAATSGNGIGGFGSVTSTQSGNGLGDRRTGKVAGPTGFGRPDQPPGNGKYAGGRTLSEIQEVFDRNKQALILMYNHQQRQNAGMSEGKLVVSITIAPDGSVTSCTVTSDSFNDPDFAHKIEQRIMLFHFLPKSVPPFNYPNYPIEFHPA